MSYHSMLSQQEVDALLAGVTGEPSEKAQQGGAHPEGIRAYDLSSPDRVVRHRMQTLEHINERFARHLRNMFFGFMRRNADITVNALRIQKYGDFERNLPVPSNLNMVSMRPLRGAALFVFDPNLVFLVVDNLFGGNGRFGIRIEGREFTNTEQRIIHKLLNQTLACYGKAWEPAHPLEFEYIRSEMHTKFASISTSNDIVVVSSFNIELGSTGGTLNICLPYSMIEPLRDILVRPLLQDTSSTVDQRWHQQLSREVTHATVWLNAEFCRIKTTVDSVLALSVGDVLPIELHDVITARVHDTPLFKCHYGSLNGHPALRILDYLLPSSEKAPSSSETPS
ncbi:flagellar motor switch protein FliM [Castellaniella sp.]|uniref:flagellar motor switch protein FliM n=1 Tax=Castellaniella sp. TaxID=1955812 RepID=UPI0035658122